MENNELLNSILALSRAGYSKSEISTILNWEPSSQPDEPGQDPEPAGKDAGTPSPDPEPAGQDPADYTEVIKTAIKSGFEDLSKVLQASEIGRSRQPEPAGSEDILAQIIAPQLKERK